MRTVHTCKNYILLDLVSTLTISGDNIKKPSQSRRLNMTRQKAAAIATQFSGRESTRLMWVLFVMISIPLFPVIQLYTGSAIFAFSWLVLVALAYTLTYWGARWKLTVHSDGVLLQRSKLWIFPHSDQFFSLGVEVAPYYSTENVSAEDVAEGYEIIPFSKKLPDRVRFGPDSYDPEFESTLQAIQAAMSEIRGDESLAAAA